MSALIVRLPNHLGDTCMALPALDLLAAHGVALTLAGQPWAQELLAGHPWPVVALPRRRAERIAALRALPGAQAGARAALLLTNSFSSAFEARLAGLRPEGYARDGRSLLLRHAYAVPHAWSQDMHTVDYYLALAHAHLGLAPAAADAPAPRLRLTTAARARARAALERAGVAPPGAHDAAYVVLCPVAQGRHKGQDKCWTGFGRLGRALAAQGSAVVICPGPGERPAAEAAVPAARMIEPLDLGAFAALLAGSAVVVANDSGPGHLAAAVGAILVGVFGVTDPSKTSPRGARVHITGGAAGWPDYARVEALVRSLLARTAPIQA